MNTFAGRIEVFPEPDLLAQYVAEWMTATALATKGSVRIALSGGSTPKALYGRLVSDTFRDRFPWRRVSWFWGDERFVPYDHPESNYRMTREAMFTKVSVPQENIHPIPSDGSPEEAARRYEQILKEAYGASTLDSERPLFDITLLGLGEDGHTASLLPGNKVLDERQRWVVAVMQGRPEIRITLTYPVIESSRHVAFLVEGAAKAPAIQRVRAGDASLPAARLRPSGELIWFIDEAAAEP
jgi:6-phosphogluconolactonase